MREVVCPYCKKQFHLRLESEEKIINSLSSGEKSFAQLRDSVGLSKPALAERIKILEGNNIICFRNDPNDRRAKIYSLVLTQAKENK